MVELLVAGFVVVFLLAASGLTRSAWREVAEALGFHFSDAILSLSSKRLEGTRRGFPVEIYEASENRTTRVFLDVHHVDPGFTLGRESFLTQLVKPDIQIGDPDFDAAIRVKGDPDHALALLDDKARRRVLRVIRDAQGTVAEGKMRVKVGKIREAPRFLEQMLDLAEALRRPRPSVLPKLLSRRALEDPSPGGRLQALRCLSSSFAAAEETREAARHLFDRRAGGSAALRLEACRVLVAARDPEDGARAAEELAKLARFGTSLESYLRRTAVETLADSTYIEVARPALAALLDYASAETPEIRRAALRGLERMGALDELRSVHLGTDPAEGVLLAGALGRLGSVEGDVQVQPRLLELLEHEADPVREAAAQALGRVGDLDAVAPLRQAAGSGFLYKSAVARAADHAIEAIKGRAGGHQAGEISLVPGSAMAPLEGAVSRADGSQGATGGDEIGGEVSLA